VLIQQLQELVEIGPFVYVNERFFGPVLNDSVFFDVRLVLKAGMVAGNEGVTESFVLAAGYEVKHNGQPALVLAQLRRQD